MARAGRYRFPVTIEKRPSGLNALGHRSEDWEVHARTLADCIELNGSERERAHQVAPSASWELRSRYIEGVTTKMRVIHGSRILEVLASVDRDQRKRELVLYCGEWVR